MLVKTKYSNILKHLMDGVGDSMMLYVLIAAVLPIPSLAHIGTLNSKLHGELEIIASTEFDHVEDRASNEGSRRFHNHMSV